MGTASWKLGPRLYIVGRFVDSVETSTALLVMISLARMEVLNLTKKNLDNLGKLDQGISIVQGKDLKPGQ